jgi:hypothetical protein
LQKLGRILGLVVGLASACVLAAGADGSWSQCSMPARLTADPAGRTNYVATWGTNPGSCPSWSGYTFRTVDAALRCAKGKDTIYVRGGTYGPFGASNLWPSDRVLVTNYPGESPTIDGWGSVADFEAVVWFWNVTNISIQGLTVQNTGVPDAQHGGYGIHFGNSTHIQVYYNTIRNTARHAVIIEGHQNDVVGNDISWAVMRNQWFQSSYWDGGYASGASRQQWGLKFVGNSVHDVFGECVDVLSLAGVTVEGNRVYNCLAPKVYVSNSRDVKVNRNYLFDNTDAYVRPGQQWRSPGIFMANEGTSSGFQLNNITITNNIVERVGQAVRFWRSHSGGSVQDTYANLYVAFNTFAHTQTWPIRFDGPDGSPQGWNRLRQNLVINDSGWDWYANDNTSNWEVAKNYNYSWGTSSTNPGVNYVPGGWPGAYELKDGASVRWVVAPNSEWNMPWDDFNCNWRNPSNWNPTGASF